MLTFAVVSRSVGLGFRDLSTARSYSFPFTLFQQGGSRSFSMLLSRVAGKSRLTFGIDRNIVGSTPSWYPVAKDPDSSWRTFWQIGQCESDEHAFRSILRDDTDVAFQFYSYRFHQRYSSLGRTRQLHLRFWIIAHYRKSSCFPLRNDEFAHLSLFRNRLLPMLQLNSGQDSPEVELKDRVTTAT